MNALECTGTYFFNTLPEAHPVTTHNSYIVFERNRHLLYLREEVSMIDQPEISRLKPALVIFLLDQSYSMNDPWGASQEVSKAQELATIINNQLTNLLVDSVKDRIINKYFYISVLGYGGEGEGNVSSAFIGPLAGESIATIDVIGRNPARTEEREMKIDDGRGGVAVRTVKMPIWIDPVAAGSTPMNKAFLKAEEIINGWVPSHGPSHPPIVFNITDGAWTGPDPTETIRRIQNTGTSRGKSFVFNCHISAESGDAIIFPEDDRLLKTDLSKQLFGLSSSLSPNMVKMGKDIGLAVSENSRGFTFNADKAAIASFLEIGTQGPDKDRLEL